MTARNGSWWALALAGVLLTAACEDGDPTAADTGAPTVVSTDPAGGATGVSLDAVVGATFSEEMDLAADWEAIFTLSDASSAVSGGFTGILDPPEATRTLQLVPLEGLASGTEYTATISTEAKDVDGTPLAAAYSWTFTTESPPVPVATMPLAEGKAWAYETEWSRSGPTPAAFSGRTILYAESEVPWEGRDAWRVLRFDLEAEPDERPFSASVSHVFQDEAGLEIWVDRADGGRWRRILSTEQAAFRNNHFLLAGDPRGTTSRMEESETPTPAGTYSTVRARVSVMEPLGLFGVFEQLEERVEHYADGVGVVYAAWHDRRSDGDPPAAALPDVGSSVLTHVDGDVSPPVLVEQEANDGGTVALAQAVPDVAIVSGRTSTADAGSVVDDPDVNANVHGVKLIQDWYRFERATDGPFRLDLAHEAGPFPDVYDIDVYLFDEETGGALAYRAESSKPGTGNPYPLAVESIVLPSLPAGAYHVAVQAWNTYDDEAAYWLAIR